MRVDEDHATPVHDAASVSKLTFPTMYIGAGWGNSGQRFFFCIEFRALYSYSESFPAFLCKTVHLFDDDDDDNNNNNNEL